MQLLHGDPHNTESRLKFDIAELADRIARGATTIPLTEIHRRAPEIFREEILASNKTEVRFPWQKMMRMLADARTAPGLAPSATGLTPAAAVSLAERLRHEQATRRSIPAQAKTNGTPQPVPAPAPARNVVRNISGGPPTSEHPASPPAAAPAFPEMRIVAADGALALPPLKTSGTTLNPPPQDDDNLSHEELLRSREAIRAQLARMKGEFARHLAAAVEARQRNAEERARFIAEMMRAKAASDDRVEQVEFEKSMGAKNAEKLTKAYQGARALQRELSALKEETGRRIEELTAERDALAQGQAVPANQAAELPKRRQAGRTMRGWAARAAGALRAPRKDPRPTTEAQRPLATLEARQPAAALTLDLEEEAGSRLEEQPATSDHLNDDDAAPAGETPAAVRRKAETVAREHPLHPWILNLWSARYHLGTLAFSAVLAAVLATWYLRLAQQDGTLSAQVRQFDREWAAVAASLDEAEKVQAPFATFLKQAKRLADERAVQGWTPALRRIAAGSGAHLELRNVRAVEKSAAPRALTLHIGGVATGTAPRTVADQFLHTLQGELERQFPGTVTTRFERLEDEPELTSAQPAQRRPTFTISAAIGLTEKPKAQSKEEI